MSEVKTNKISSLASNNDITIDPDGTGDVVVASGHKLGVGTTSPSVEAHIQTASGNPELRVESTGANYATMSVKNSSRHYSTQIRTDQSNAYVVRDETGGANRFLIDTSGNVGIGTTPSGARLDINASANEIGTDILCENTSQTSDVLRVSASRNTTDNTYMLIRASCNGVADRFQVRDSGNVKNVNNSYGAISDERMKENIVDAASQWDDIKALQVRKYNRLGDTQKELGVIAQELEASGMGGLVEEGEYYDVDNNPDEETRKSVKYSILYMKAVKALQEAMTRIEALETEMNALKARVTALENA